MSKHHPKASLSPGIAAITVFVGTLGSTLLPAYANFNVPTDAPASPLFGATDFSQKLLMFEEFGTRPIPTTEASAETLLPAPDGCRSVPDGAQLDSFLAQSLFPLPGEMSDSYSLGGGHPNPWDSKIKECLPGVFSTIMDARPPGKWFAHQRWDEFKPEIFFQTAMTGSRSNGGLRNQYQRHGYAMGEFGPGGLYYNTVFSFDDPNLDHAFDGTTKGIAVRIHPQMPVQDAKSVWTFDGTLPPKLLMARYGEPILFRHHNALAIDPGANNGFGANTITTHEHNGHNPGESDGFAHAYSYPGQYYDYHWPMILAGHDSINKTAMDPRAGRPDGSGGITNIPGDAGEVMSTHWFHDHMLDYTAQNVYKGNAAMMNYYSSVDRGREPATLDEAKTGPAGYRCHYADPANPGHVNLCLPSGTGLDWGNRDYDVNLVIADKAWSANGQLFFNIFNSDGFLGDRMTVNWQYKPYLDVRARRYRFRLLNGSVSRFMKFALVDETGKQVPFHLIANDGNIMEYAIPFPNSQSQEGLPSQAIAERYDIVVDFKGYTGKKLYLVNLMEHASGLGPNQAIPLADVLSGKYKADGISGDPAIGKFMEFRVHALAEGQSDLSMNPADYVPGKLQMIPRPVFTAEELQSAKHRTFEFGRSGGGGTDDKPWSIKTDGGGAMTADEHRVSAAPEEGSVEIWHIRNGGSGWAHPVHVHFEEGQILLRGGKAPPIWEQYARKDVYRVGPLADTTNSVDLAIRVRDFIGTYVEHCHNTQHEDKAMLLRWDIQHSSPDSEHGLDTQRNAQRLIAIPTPMMDWNGAWYEDSYVLPTYKVGDTKAAASMVIIPKPVTGSPGNSSSSSSSTNQTSTSTGTSSSSSSTLSAKEVRQAARQAKIAARRAARDARIAARKAAREARIAAKLAKQI